LKRSHIQDDLKNIIEITFPDNGVSVLYYMCVIVHVVILFFIFIFIFIFIFGGCGSTVGRSRHITCPIAEIPTKKGKTNI